MTFETIRRQTGRIVTSITKPLAARVTLLALIEVQVFSETVANHVLPNLAQ